MANSNYINSDSRISFTLKEVMGIIIFLVGLGIPLGGFMTLRTDVDKLDTKINEITKQVEANNLEIKVIDTKMNYKYYISNEK